MSSSNSMVPLSITNYACQCITQGKDVMQHKRAALCAVTWMGRANKPSHTQPGLARNKEFELLDGTAGARFCCPTEFEENIESRSWSGFLGEERYKVLE